MAYGHASGRDLPELFDSIRKHLELGFRSIRVQTRVPGIDAVYGVAAQPSVGGQRYDYEPAQRAPLPAEEDWDTRAYLRHMPDRVRGGPQRVRPRAAAAARRAPPDDPDPGRPARARTSSRTTCSGSRTARPAENQEALRLVRQHTTTPLAIGEVFNTVWDYQTLIREQLIDYVRSAVTHTGGITAHAQAARLRRAVPDQVRHPRARPTSRRSAWPPRCTWTWRSTTSASRSTCSTAP